MSEQPLIDTNSPQYPSYFRLYWKEIRNLIDADADLRQKIGQILGIPYSF